MCHHAAVIGEQIPPFLKHERILAPCAKWLPKTDCLTLVMTKLACQKSENETKFTVEFDIKGDYVLIRVIGCGGRVSS